MQLSWPKYFPFLSSFSIGIFSSCRGSWQCHYVLDNSLNALSRDLLNILEKINLMDLWSPEQTDMDFLEKILGSFYCDALCRGVAMKWLFCAFCVYKKSWKWDIEAIKATLVEVHAEISSFDSLLFWPPTNWSRLAHKQTFSHAPIRLPWSFVE